jgi:phosphoribosylaminoimidazole-succinocarboxamide synthase
VLLLETALAGVPKRRGKVRDIYDLGDRLLLVATDRISAYDWVLPNGIPGKGRILTQLSRFWFDRLGVPNHCLGFDDAVAEALTSLGVRVSDEDRNSLALRSTLVKKAEVVPFECVVRGYLSGSGWREYRASGTVCGEPLPKGLVESDRISPLFTPATKATSGHDENIPFSQMEQELGSELAGRLKKLSLKVYQQAAAHALERGLILADTKLEWGFDHQSWELLLVDEVLTPDSSRYWPLEGYKPGGTQPSFDKQFVRDWLDRSGWDKASPPPALPADVVAKTQQKYEDVFTILTGGPFDRRWLS